MKPTARLQLLRRIGRLGVTGEMDFKAASKVTITNLAACAHVLLTLPYFWFFRSLGASQLAILVLPLSALFALIPLINRAGYTLLSRHLLLGAINVNVYLFTASLGLESFIQNVFFFTLISPLMIFSFDQWRSILVCVLQPVVLWAFLLWKGAWVVPAIQLEPWAYAALRPAISSTTASMLFSCSFLIVWLQRQSERRLELARAAAEAKQRLEVVGKLASGIAHDFNNLLVVIMGSTSVLLEELRGVAPENRELLQEIEAAAVRAAAITRQLLAAGRSRLAESTTLDLGRVVREFEPMLRRLLGDTLTVQVVTMDEVVVHASRGGLEQVLLNLAVNARDAMGTSGVLRMSVGKANSHAVLEVNDDGAGMDVTTQARAFEAFFTTKATGTGLGLATVQDITERFGGSVELSSQVGRGTTVTVRLPLCAAAAAESQPGHSRAILVPRRALLVEDQEAVRRAVTQMLQRLAFDVTAVVDGAEALALLESTTGFDLIVSDLAMPRLGGEELVIELQKRAVRTPVLFISGNLEKPPLEPASLSVGFLQKPFIVPELERAIQAILRRQAMSREAASLEAVSRRAI
jgi:signal transduction histidine kinase/ActR/RegA family two-component response regulator